MPSSERQPDRWIGGALYPDVDPPLTLASLGDRVDFPARLCAAWDLGRLPDPPLLTEIRQPEWRAAVEECRLLTPPTYHLLQSWNSLPSLPYLEQRLAYIADDPNLAHV